MEDTGGRARCECVEFGEGPIVLEAAVVETVECRISAGGNGKLSLRWAHIHAHWGYDV